MSTAFLRSLLSCAAALALASGPLSAQQIRGIVYDGGSGAVLPGAQVQVRRPPSEDAVGSATTDEAGTFAIVLDIPGIYVATVVMDGYEAGAAAQVLVRSDETAEVMLSLTATDPSGIQVRSNAVLGETSIVYGQVLDGESGRPVEDVEVILGGGRGTAVTRWDGRFLFPEVVPGAVLARVRHLAYGTLDEMVEVEPGRAYELVATVREEPIPLEGIEVTVRSRPAAKVHREVLFRYDRNVGGVFLTDRDFERRGHPVVGDMLRELPSTFVHRAVHGLKRAPPTSLFFTVSGRIELDPYADWTWWVTLRGGCIPAIFVDGHLASHPGAEQTWIMEMSTLDVEIMEVYPSPAFLPPEFNVPGAMCAIGIWTRRGG